MKNIGKVGLLLVFTVLLLNVSTSFAWFGHTHKSARNSGFTDEATTSSWSSSSSFLNRGGSSIVFQVHGNVYPVGYVFFFHNLFLL